LHSKLVGALCHHSTSKQVVDDFHFSRQAEGSIASGNGVDAQEFSSCVQDIARFVV